MKKKAKKKTAGAAKKKDARTITEKVRDALRKEMNDDSAADTFAGLGYSSVREVLPTGIDVVDRHALGIGGLPYGRVTEISGGEDTCKSSLINHIMAAAQRDGAVASLGDSERKVQPNWVEVFKVKRDDVLLLPARTIEEYLQELTIVLRKFRTTKFVFCLDSIATTIPQKALEQDLTESEIPGASAAAWSRGLKALNPLLSESRSMLILVNQLRSKIGVMYGPTEETACGRAIKYYTSLRIAMNHGKSVKDGKMHVGKWASLHPFKNHLAPNHRGAKILLNFETGFDDARSTLMHAKEVGAVDAKCQSVKEARRCLGWEKDEAEPDQVIADVEIKEGR